MDGQVVIVGAGIAGLTAAFHLARRGADVTLLEGSKRAGGVILSEISAGYLIEHGPNSAQPTAELSRLIESLGLQSEILSARTVQRNRFVVRDGRLVPLPLRPGSFVTSRLFSPVAKVRILREPFIGPGLPDESVADFVRRRVGDEFLDYAINPFVAGVFAGDPEQLSMKHAFPGMVGIEQEHGSLIRGLIARGRSGDKRAQPDSDRTPFTFRAGMETLPRALWSALTDRIRLGARVRSLSRTDVAWRVETGEDVISADAVVSTIPIHQFKGLQISPPVGAPPVIEYAPLTIVALGFRKADVPHALDGFGVLVPEVEQQFRILGALFSSSLFPGRAPADHVLLTAFLGGKRHSDAPYLASDAAAGVAIEDLRILLGIQGKPAFQRVIPIRLAIPQYHVGYDRTLARLSEIEDKLPGLFFSGNYCRGVSLGDTITYATKTAEKALNFVRSGR